MLQGSTTVYRFGKAQGAESRLENILSSENFDSQAFYDQAVKFTTNWEGYPEWGFTETMRYSVKHIAIYEARADVEDVVRVSDWLPVTGVTE
ncbi:MAG: hypothetical protein ISS53_00735 [Dehalococcoidia bacterium]|nr:hypothetical protein [Dehalococcoidia bacterium]